LSTTLAAISYGLWKNRTAIRHTCQWLNFSIASSDLLIQLRREHTLFSGLLAGRAARDTALSSLHPG
jgi:hypothetical protein